MAETTKFKEMKMFSTARLERFVVGTFGAIVVGFSFIVAAAGPAATNLIA